MYKYYHHSSGQEILSEKELNQLDLDKYFELTESYADFEDYLIELNPEIEEIKFSSSKFRKWLEKQPIKIILQHNEIEVTKVKVIS